MKDDHRYYAKSEGEDISFMDTSRPLTIKEVQDGGYVQITYLQYVLSRAFIAGYSLAQIRKELDDLATVIDRLI